jgi:hypothetical protein
MPYSNIDSPKKYFDTKLYTGTGSTQSISGLSFKPDWLWIKSRSTTGNGRVHDVIRGVDKQLYTSLTNAEFTYSPNTGVTSFNTDGFSLGSDIGQNENGTTYASWNWLASNTTASNTSGSITSTVSANTTAGFSIVSYTGTGASATVGHGLNVAPSFLITKNRSGTDSWIVHTKAITATTWWDTRLLLNATNAAGSGAGYLTAAPTSTLFAISSFSAINASGNNYITYCFAEVKGFSKFGSYTGNGSATDGTFVYTGFKPRFIMLKGTTLVSSWVIFDTVRSTINPVPITGGFLLANSSNAEAGTGDSGAYIDILSNGFKIRNNSGFDNNSGSDTYIYMAIAENPFVSSKGLPCTAR